MIIKDGHIITERFHGTVPINSKYHGDKLVWHKKYKYILPFEYQEVEYIENDTKFVYGADVKCNKLDLNKPFTND